MPCYLFTYHAYRSWLPDRPRGFVKRHEGILPPDKELADEYRKRAKADLVSFSNDIQREMIEELLRASEHQKFRTHCAATDRTHLHALVSWKTDCPWLQVRTGLKSSLTRKLNEQFVKRPWFSEGASRKRCKDQAHFDYLVNQYLAKHVGWKWSEAKGMYL